MKLNFVILSFILLFFLYALVHSLLHHFLQIFNINVICVSCTDCHLNFWWCARNVCVCLCVWVYDDKLDSFVNKEVFTSSRTLFYHNKQTIAPLCIEISYKVAIINCTSSIFNSHNFFLRICMKLQTATVAATFKLKTMNQLIFKCASLFRCVCV